MTDTMTFPRTRQGVRNLDAIKGRVLPISSGSRSQATPHSTAARNERIAFDVIGGVLTVFGLSRMSFSGLGIALIGSAFIYSGVTGRCPFLDMTDHARPQWEPGAGPETVYRVQ